MMKQMLKLLGGFVLVLTIAFAPISLAQTAFAAPSPSVKAAGAGTNDPISYTVQPGDYLSEIAQTYNTTVSAILALNPQITNPSLIYPGEVLLIPVGTNTTPIIPITGSGASAVITPTSGPQGTYIQVVVTGFPADTPVQIGLHKLNRSLIESTADTTTDAYGSATVTMRIPSGANPNIGTVWLAKVSTTSGESVTAESNQFVISTTTGTTGSTFTYIVQSGDTLASIASRYGTSVAAIQALNPQIVSQGYIYTGESLIIPIGAATNPIIPITGSGPAALITPTSGPQGTYIEVIVTGFPADTPIKIGLHKLNRTLIESHTSATTNAYGSATVTMRIPTGKNVNNNRFWLAQVSTTSGESITINSNEFNVTGN
jgi:LysM repeat protein